MKFYTIASLAALASGIQAHESMSSVTCSGCPEQSSTIDIVTREPLPTSSCTEPPLTVVSDHPAPSGWDNSTGTMPTDDAAAPESSESMVPEAGATNNGFNQVTGLVAFAAAAIAYML